MIELPSALVDARWIPSRRAAIGLLTIAVVVALIFGVRVWRVQSQQPEPIADTAAAPGVSSGGSPLLESPSPPISPGNSTNPGNSTSPGSSTSPGATQLVVHLVGKVQKPGVYRLPPGSRVSDAVAAAGGMTPQAVPESVNLARQVLDGEQIVVPGPGEQPQPAPGPAGTGVGAGSSSGTGATSGSGAGSGGGGPVDGAKISINAADATTLDTLPGVGPVLAQRIIEWRSQNGRFTNVDELGEVSGIGEKVLERIRPKVTL